MAGTITASVVKNDTTSPPAFQNSAGTEIGQLCRAWVNFNGGTTPTIRASFNVSSVTRGGTGQYAVNLTTNMPDGNFSVAGAAMRNSASGGSMQAVNILRGTTYSASLGATGVQIQISNGADTAEDPLACCVAIFR